MGRCGQESRSTKIAGSCQRSAGRESACSSGDLGSIPESGRSPGEGKGYPLQYSGLENSMDCIAHVVTKRHWISLMIPSSCNFILSYLEYPLSYAKSCFVFAMIGLYSGYSLGPSCKFSEINPKSTFSSCFSHGPALFM